MDEGHSDARPRIAAVDDDPVMLRLVTLALGGEYQVAGYGDPGSALEAFAAGDTPDLVVSDMMMPRMTGLELHERTRSLPAMRSVPWLFLSAMDEREHVRRAMIQGADDYLTKPFAPEELRDAVRARLERAGSLRSHVDGIMRVNSLGGMSIVIGDRRLQWEAGKVVVLLLYLLERDSRAPVRDVVAALWSGHVQDNTVRVLINRARRTLGDAGRLRVQHETIHLEAPRTIAWDAQLFEEAAERALEDPGPRSLEAAIKLYSGEFLPGVDSPWVDTARARYENLYLELLEAAVEHAATEAEAEQARARLEAWYGE